MDCCCQGLSFPTASSTRQNLSMPFLSMVRNKLLDAPLFSLWLNPESTKSYAGELVFGKINRLRYTDELQYATVEPDSNGCVFPTPIIVGLHGQNDDFEQC